MVTQKSTQKHMFKLWINSFLNRKPKEETFINHVDSNEIVWHYAISHKGLSKGAGWLSGRVLDSGLRGWPGCGFEPHRSCCIVHGLKFSGLFLNSGFLGLLSIESQPQNAELWR